MATSLPVYRHDAAVWTKFENRSAFDDVTGKS